MKLASHYTSHCECIGFILGILELTSLEYWKLREQAKVFDENPFSELPPEEIPLKNAPLVRVISQVRFPVILSIGESRFIASFQEQIRQEYPTLQPEQTHEFFVTPQGFESRSPGMVWRFIDGTKKWRVSLTSSFVSLETTEYKSRSDFLERLQRILIALNNHVKPQMFERLGLRYIARLTGEEVDNITKFVRPEVAGILGAELSCNVEQSISDSFFSLPSEAEKIHARWGVLPAQTTIDPNAIEAISEQSWILDLDMFTTPFSEQKDFNVDAIMLDSEHFAERLYSVFRWAVTSEFLIHFGGKI